MLCIYFISHTSQSIKRERSTNSLFSLNQISYIFAVTPPAQRVQSLLGLDPKEQVHETHPLFSEMAELIHNNEGEMEWHETAR